MLATESPFPQYFDLDGTPLNNGSLYFGVANQNPETNPITVYWDAAGTQPAAQPIQTINGYAVRSGAPASIFVNGDYSLNVRNGRGNLVFYAPTSNNPVIEGSVARTVSAITTLDATGLPDGAVIIAKGRSASGDGGGGVFRYSAAGAQTVDGGTVFAPATGPGRLFRDGWTVFGFNGPLRPQYFGAKGDNAADDAAALNSCSSASFAYGAIDLGGLTYRITAPIGRPAIGVTVRNGRLRLDNAASNAFYAWVANDYCTFEGVHFLGAAAVGSAGVPKYQGGIFGGNTLYAAPMNTAPANGVTVRGCHFQDLTVGVWSGGASTDATPTGWSVVGNKFRNIVGLPGNSEGYGVLFTPSSDGQVIGNTFETVRRHAIYIAGEASNNVIGSNVIDGCDNIAIQSNTLVTQNYASGNVYIGNTIKGLTRSIAYGYRSSIGIGLYGKHENTIVSDNRIFGALDTGIDAGGELGGSAYADRVTISGNQIVMEATATDTGIRLDGVLSGKVCGNHIKLKGSIYGAVITSNASVGSDLIDVSENTIDTDTAGAVAFRMALAATRVVRVFRNQLNGFQNAYANRLNDTSTAGTRRTDLNANTGYYGNDADLTHVARGTTAHNDSPSIRHAGVLTAARSVTLTNPTNEVGAEVTVMRTGGGAFNLNIVDGGTIKALSTGQWGRFVWNGGGWELAAFGSL